MMTCPQCGGQVRYIVSAKRDGSVFMVNDAPIAFINDKGRQVTGYMVHRCTARDAAPGNGEGQGNGLHN